MLVIVDVVDINIHLVRWLKVDELVTLLASLLIFRSFIFDLILCDVLSFDITASLHKLYLVLITGWNLFHIIN